MSTAQHIAIIGGGPAGLIAAETLARACKSVTVYDRMPSVGRKFLMAGRGGLNLTHSDPFEKLITRYGTATPHLLSALEAFPPEALVAWCEELGQPTFIGSSGRIFPKTFKASPLLRAWLKRLGELGVTFKTQHRWTGWTNDQLTFETPDGSLSVQADATDPRPWRCVMAAAWIGWALEYRIAGTPRGKTSAFQGGQLRPSYFVVRYFQNQVRRTAA